MASIGIDFGTSFCCVAACIDGKVEVISNELDSRLTPSYVAFTEDERLFGDAAQNQAPVNLKNTVYQIKRLIGRTVDNEAVQKYQQYWGFEIDLSDNHLRIPITYREKKYKLRPEQIAAMLLEQMKHIAEEYLNENVDNAFISVPACFIDQQRNAIQDAGFIAGFKNVRLIDEPKAAARAFAENRNISDRRNVLIFDIGGGKFDVAIYVIEGSNVIEALAAHGNPSFGGDDFDINMMDNINVCSGNKKGMFRLRVACEKAKKKFSASKQARLQADCINGNEPYNTTLTRSEFEEINKESFKSIEQVLRNVLTKAKIVANQIDDIVLVGGSTRIPKIREFLREFFDGKALNRTVNPDEAVACGAAYYAEQAFNNDRRHEHPNADNERKLTDEIRVMIQGNAIFNQEDEQARQLNEARNNLEAYIHKITKRAKDSSSKLDEDQKRRILKKCDSTILWLEEYGENANTDDLDSKRADLKAAYENIKFIQNPQNEVGDYGFVDGEDMQTVMKPQPPDEVKQALGELKKARKSIKCEVTHDNSEINYEDIQKITDECDKIKAWVKKTKNPNLDQISNKHHELEDLFQSIMNSATKKRKTDYDTVKQETDPNNKNTDQPSSSRESTKNISNPRASSPSKQKPSGRGEADPLSINENYGTPSVEIPRALADLKKTRRSISDQVMNDNSLKINNEEKQTLLDGCDKMKFRAKDTQRKSYPNDTVLREAIPEVKNSDKPASKAGQWNVPGKAATATMGQSDSNSQTDLISGNHVKVITSKPTKIKSSNSRPADSDLKSAATESDSWLNMFLECFRPQCIEQEEGTGEDSPLVSQT
uniref:heat shock 70 kDa protein 1-like isoform X2 n=1 Tax=Styela clava TaxID=7725 RepID=UPI00193A63CC|nr:heat shock 70 kDa protein 1-like isoform X2 [Styela clava]